jgi:exopolysaccharide biosynthesis polyprenyl glycosylphosphotransferase
MLDIATIGASLFIARELHARLQGVVPALREAANFERHAALVYLVIPLWLLLVVALGLHHPTRPRLSTADLAFKLFKLHLAGFAGLSIIQFLTQATINRSLVALFLLCTFTLMFAQRRLMLAWSDYQYKVGISHERVLLVGRPSRRMAELLRSASQQAHAPHFIGYVEAPLEGVALSIPPPEAPVLPCIGKLDDLPDVLHEQAIDHVLFFPPANRPERMQDQLAACEEVGIAASFSVDLVQLGQAAPRVTSKYDHAFVTFEMAPKSRDALSIKYGLDPVLAALGIALLSPVFAIVAAAIWATMGRPIFFSQPRGGLFNRPFRMIKFRTMRAGAETERQALAELNEMSGPVFKIAKDPRVTPLGNFLRRTSLDELPQLFNVLTGAMSLVGPRPLPVQEQAQIHGWQRRRLSMKPGITCLWQVGGRSDTDFVDWMLLDLKYIDEWSLWLDFQILLKTVPAVLLRRGAR